MRVIVVGCGNQGRKRIKALAPEDELVAIIEPDFKQLNRDVGRPYSQACKGLVDDLALDYDAAIVCTPTNEQKWTIVRWLLLAGKHVLVEKPLWPAPVEGLQELQDIAMRSKLMCYTAYNHRYEPAIARLRAELVAKNGWRRLSGYNEYSCRMFYGNGTARNVKDSWRDKIPLGVIAEVGCHLLDLSYYLELMDGRLKFELLNADAFETKKYDHALLLQRAVLGTARSPSIQLEMSYLSWKNTFTIDIYGTKGSLHVDGLTKWGSSTFTRRKRVFPSGVPIEESTTYEQPDSTWDLEWRAFTAWVRDGIATDLSSDMWMASTFNAIEKELEENNADRLRWQHAFGADAGAR